MAATSEGSAGRGWDVRPSRSLRSFEGQATLAASAASAASGAASSTTGAAGSVVELSWERSELQGSRKPLRVSVFAMVRALFLVNGRQGRGLRAP
jgi:hypothetical protein